MSAPPVQDRIAPQPWMQLRATGKVIAALEAAGGPGCALFVGGCVRNAIMDRPVDDIDIATVLTPLQVSAAITAAGLKAVPTGIDHGTVTAVADHIPFEITTLRRDVETDGRRAVVAFTTDWREDAERRDFRLNAIYCDVDGRLFDPTGEGVADARAGRIVFVGDAETRVREDYLRILRFFRFFAWYGRGEPDPHGLQVCADRREGLRTLSVERVAKELLKLLAAEDPRPTVRRMADAGVLAEVLPEAQDLRRLEGLAAFEPPRDGLLRLASLLPPDAEVAARAARRLKLSNAQRERLVGAAGPIDPLASDRQLREAVHRLGRQAVLDRLILAAAATAELDSADLEARLRFVETTQVAPSPFTGAEVVAAGVPAGPRVGAIQKRLERWWIEHDFDASPEERRSALHTAVSEAMATDGGAGER